MRRLALAAAAFVTLWLLRETFVTWQNNQRWLFRSSGALWIFVAVGIGVVTGVLTPALVAIRGLWLSRLLAIGVGELIILPGIIRCWSSGRPLGMEPIELLAPVVAVAFGVYGGYLLVENLSDPDIVGRRGDYDASGNRLP